MAKVDGYTVFFNFFIFFTRTSNFGAEAERSDIFLRSEVEHNVLNMFLNLHGIPLCIT